VRESLIFTSILQFLSKSYSRKSGVAALRIGDGQDPPASSVIVDFFIFASEEASIVGIGDGCGVRECGQPIRRNMGIG
jgi:hypothetical protein